MSTRIDPRTWLAENGDILIPTAVAAAIFTFLVATLPTPPILKDALGYAESALRLIHTGRLTQGLEGAAGSTLPSAFRTPGYPLFLAAIYTVATRPELQTAQALAVAQPWVIAAQTLLAIGLVAMVAACGRAIGGPRLAIVAGLGAALYAPFAWASTVALSDQLGAFALTGALLVALLAVGRPAPRSTWWWIAVGALGGAAAMVRPVFALWVVAPCAYLVLARLESWRRTALLLAAVALGLSAVYVPWGVRNAVSVHRFALLAGNEGQTMFDGTGGGDLSASEQRLYDATIAGGGDADAALAAVARARTSAKWSASPAGFILGRMQRAGTVVVGHWTAPAETIAEIASDPYQPMVRASSFPEGLAAWLHPLDKGIAAYQVLLVALALVGVALAWWTPRLWLIASVPAYLLAVHFTTLFIDRYFYPAMPAVILLAAAAVVGAAKVAASLVRPEASAQDEPGELAA